MASSYEIRLAKPEDLGGFLTLAELAGPGFTSLSPDEKKLAALLKASKAASKGAQGAVMLAMEDRSTRRIAGCAAVKRGGEKRPGFANFRVIRDAGGAVRSLVISDDYSNLTEIGGLFVHPDHRSKGVGKALAQSRYLYLATAPETFGARVFAELRGVIGPNGASPFYDAACKSWLKMSFLEADRLCAAGENERLVSLLPKKPFSTETFSPQARAAIGDCHDSGKAARAMLEKEGFYFDGVVDLLDGGALMVANTVSLTSIRQSRLARIKAAAHFAKTDSLLFATTRPDMFRCVAGRGAILDNAVLCDADIFDTLQVREGDVIRVSAMQSQTSAKPQPLDTLATSIL